MRVIGPDPDRIQGVAHGVVEDYLRHSPGHRWARDDLLSDAMYGAADALRRWQPDRGVSVQSFLRHRMRGAILDGIRTRATIPRSVYLKGLRDRDLPDWKRTPISLDSLRERLQSKVYSGSGDQDLAVLADPAAERQFAAVDEHLAARQLLGHLPERQRELITRLYLDGESGREVAADWGVTESRVCQIRGQALRRLRRQLERESA